MLGQRQGRAAAGRVLERVEVEEQVQGLEQVVAAAMRTVRLDHRRRQRSRLVPPSARSRRRRTGSQG